MSMQPKDAAWTARVNDLDAALRLALTDIERLGKERDALRAELLTRNLEIAAGRTENARLRETVRATVETTRAEVAATWARLGTAERLLEDTRCHLPVWLARQVDDFLAAPSPDSPVAGEGARACECRSATSPPCAFCREAAGPPPTAGSPCVYCGLTYLEHAASSHPFSRAPDAPDPLAPVLAKLTKIADRIFDLTGMNEELTAKVAALDKAAHLRWGDYENPPVVPGSAIEAWRENCRRQYAEWLAAQSAPPAPVAHRTPSEVVGTLSAVGHQDLSKGLPAPVAEPVMDIMDALKAALAPKPKPETAGPAPAVQFTNACAVCHEMVSDGRAVHRACDTGGAELAAAVAPDNGLLRDVRAAIDDLRRTWALQERRLQALEPDDR
jgi:hypothetical protein